MCVCVEVIGMHVGALGISTGGSARRCLAGWQRGYKFVYSDAPPFSAGPATIECSTARTPQRNETSYAYGGYRALAVCIHKKILSYKYISIRI